MISSNVAMALPRNPSNSLFRPTGPLIEKPVCRRAFTIRKKPHETLEEGEFIRLRAQAETDEESFEIKGRYLSFEDGNLLVKWVDKGELAYTTVPLDDLIFVAPLTEADGLENIRDLIEAQERK
jgi:hypothetical protein